MDNLTINIKEIDGVRTFTLRGKRKEVVLREDQARRIWEAFAPYFDGREVADV